MIPLWAITAIGAGAVAGFAGWQAASSIEGAKLERERTAWANERTKAAESYAEKEREYRATEQRWRDNQRESMEIAHAEIDRLQATVRRADAASVGLRSQFAAFVSETVRASESAATESERQAARARAGMQADVLRELDALAGIYAAEADRRRIAGLACEREHALAE